MGGARRGGVGGAPLPEICTIDIGAAAYPQVLLELTDPPPVLYLRGRLDLLAGRRIAIVGSRAATPVGRRAAERISRDLSAAGVTVVSGMAFGIDGAAHRGALGECGGTIAVLGSGPDRPYPSAHRELYERIATEGLLVSEFPPGEMPRPYHFPRRNRIIAALASGVVVVEAARKSGALITVDHALDLGREVFGVPGSLENPQAEGVHALIREGAHLVTSAAEILETMGWVPADLGPLFAEVEGSGIRLDRTPRSLDELVEGSGLSPAKLLSLLTRMEMEGRAVRGPEGWRHP